MRVALGRVEDGAEELTFTPDSRGLVFTARDAGREEAWSTNLDLFVAPIDGSAPPRNLTAANKGQPIEFVAPAPTANEIGAVSIVKGGPNVDAARAFVDWVLTPGGGFTRTPSAPI